MDFSVTFCFTLTLKNSRQGKDNNRRKSIASCRLLTTSLLHGGIVTNESKYCYIIVYVLSTNICCVNIICVFLFLNTSGFDSMFCKIS